VEEVGEIDRPRPHASLCERSAGSVADEDVALDALQEGGVPAYVSIRQHTSAYVSIREHT
jgi:hypothetical protein